MSGRVEAVQLSLRSGLVLGVASVTGLMMLCWPLLLQAEAGQRIAPPFLFLVLLPLIIAVVLAEISEGGLDPRVLAILGVLSAVNAVLRALSPGLAGVELTFFLLILAGRVYGPGFGFVLGCTSLFASALLTAGVGPWLPFQMIVSAWVGMGAGLLPRRFTGRAEIVLLAAYGIVAAYAFGMLMNLSGWPFVAGIAVPGEERSLSYVPGAPLLENLHRFLLYTLLTSTGGWDTIRAITNAVGIALLGPAVLTTLRRASRRALVTPESATRGLTTGLNPRVDQQDPVVGGGGGAAAVAVGRRHPEHAVGGRDHGPQPAVLTHEEVRGVSGLAVGDVDPPEPDPAERGHPQVAVGVGQPGR